MNSAIEAAIPKGVTDFLPEQAEMIGYIEGKIRTVFELWGFRRIIPPMLEFADVLAAGMDDDLQGKAFRFDDRQSGRLLAIPPDITPQVARIEAMRMSGYPLPHRLYYNGRVLRHAESQTGRSREIMQAGVELIGLDSPEADAEMVAMAVAVFHELGITGFKIDLGQVEFFRGILAAAGLDRNSSLLLQQAVAKKDASAVRSFLDTAALPDAAKEEIAALPRLFGGTDLLSTAAAVVRNDRSRRALDNLAEVVHILGIHGIGEELTVDLGEIRGLHYHTGVTFEGFVSGLGQPVCSGGRYDDLMARYGLPAPATGFAFNVLALLGGLADNAELSAAMTRDLLIFNMLDDRRDALAIATRLRHCGYSVARDIIRRDLEQSLAYARRMNISLVMVIGEEGCSADDVCLIRVADGVKKQVAKSALLAGDCVAALLIQN